MYLIGGKRGAAFRGLRGNGVLVSEESSRSWYSEPVFLAKLCAGASFVGMVFLVSCYFMLWAAFHSTVVSTKA